MKVWAKVKIAKRQIRRTFGRRTPSREGLEEYVIKIEGFSGELRKTMTAKEANAWVEKSNGAAFKAASEASRGGLNGVEEFTKYGKGTHGMSTVVMRALAKNLGDSNKENTKNGKRKD